MTQAQQGDSVRVHYTGKLEDGRIFDSSALRGPLRFTIGQGELIPGFEQAVVGMSPGQSKTVTIPMAAAYGPHRPERVIAVERHNIPAHIELAVGRQVQARQADGSAILFTVTAVSEASVTLDANHPLAGHDLIFELQLLEIG
jgi:peptidylprolyl isomerase